MPIITLSHSERRKVSLFLTCLFLSAMAWLFLALSKSYFYRVNTQIRYTNFPQAKAFHPMQSDTATLQIEGSGWQILFSHLRIKPSYIDVDLAPLNQRPFIVLSDQLNAINKQLGPNKPIVSVSPDTLYFDLAPQFIKRVPVKLIYRANFKKQFFLSGNIDIDPTYVIVAGPQEDIEKITFWPSDTLKEKDICSDIFAQVSLQKSRQANINVYPNVLDVKIPVEEFTEKSVDVPLTVLNNHGYDVKLLPEKVQVKFLVALSDYHQISDEFFEAIVDLDNWFYKHHDQLMVKLIKAPPYCKPLSIEPQAVDFMVKKYVKDRVNR